MGKFVIIMNNLCPHCHSYCVDDEVLEGVCPYCGYQVQGFEWEYDRPSDECEGEPDD